MANVSIERKVSKNKLKNAEQIESENFQFLNFLEAEKRKNSYLNNSNIIEFENEVFSKTLSEDNPESISSEVEDIKEKETKEESKKQIIKKDIKNEIVIDKRKKK
jgi:hypothetical protein